MNKREKEFYQYAFNAEEDVLHELAKQYKVALDDINEKIMILQSNDLTQSKIYQLQYQQALKGQVEGILAKLHSDEYSTIQKFLEDSYTNGFVGTMYSIHGQGIPLMMPIDQKAAVKAILTDSKISKSLYDALGVDTSNLKKAIRQEITRGIATNLSNADIARNISNATKAPLARAKTIVRTENHRIQQSAAYDAQKASKASGADVVKQWDSTLDGRTRPTHRQLDGQIQEIDKPFKMGGMEAMFPGDFGDPAEDCNCRCVSLTRAKWALDDDELQTLKDRAEYFGLDKTKDFEDFKEKYLDASMMATASDTDNDWTNAKPRTLSKEEKAELVDYAKEHGITLVDMKQFDGDADLLKSGVDVVGGARSAFGLKSKIVVGFSNSLPDGDFASTVGSHITFNAKALRNREVTEGNISVGGQFASTTVEDLFLHEFGHIFLAEKGNKGLEIARTAYYNVFGQEVDIDEIFAYLYDNVSPYSIATTDSGNNKTSVGKKFKEIVSEVLAKNNSNSDDFTKEFVNLLKGK